MNGLHLPADWPNRMSRFSIAAASKVRGSHKGAHRSNRFGASMEFSDFREYHPGDDIRHIDWNVYGRTERVYIKRFLDEQERSIHLLLDDSRSMASTWLFAKQLTFSLGLMALSDDDRLSLSLGRNNPAFFRKKGRNARKLLEHFLTGLPEPAARSFTGSANFEAAKRSAVMIVLSDGLESISEWERFFKEAIRFSQEVRFLRLVSKEEAKPPHQGDVQLIDSETEKPLNVSISSAALRNYYEQQRLHTGMLESLCRRYGIHYLEVYEDDGIQEILLKQLPKQNWVR